MVLGDFDVSSLAPALKAVADSGLSITVGGNTSSTLPTTNDTFPTGLAIGLGVAVLGAMFLFSRGRKV